MDEKLQKLYCECINELESIGLKIKEEKEIGKIDISIAKRVCKRYGCCKQEKPDENSKVIKKIGRRKYVTYERYYIHHIEISKWVMELDEKIIKNTIMHELIHCFPGCNNHGNMFKDYAKMINQKLGYDISRLGNKAMDYKKSNLEYSDNKEIYKYKIICTNCGQMIYRKRLKKILLKKYRCGICNGKLKIIQQNNY